MRAWRLWAMALAAVAGLGAAVVLTALGSANGAPRGYVLTSTPNLPARTVTPWNGPCVTRIAGAGLHVGGACRGSMPLRFACTIDGELEALSARAPLGGGQELYVTILLNDYAGPGDYVDDELTAQVIGPPVTPRWTSAGSYVDIEVGASGANRIGDAVLLPELGTPATGVVTLHGAAVCPGGAP